MDLSRGCVLIARSLDESDIFQNEKWLKVFIWCLIQANHKGKNVPVNIGRSTTSVWVERGQFIFGRHKAAEKLGMSPSTVRNIMQKLVDLKNVDMQKDTHYSIVTIREYDFYQTTENYTGQAKGQAEDSQRTAGGQPVDTTNTLKKIPKIVYDSDSLEMNICKWFFSVLQRSRPEQKEPNWQNWCSDIELFIRIDKPTNEEIKTVINFAHDPANATDKFSWIPNLRSPKKLREHFERILLQSRTRKPTQEQNEDEAWKRFEQHGASSEGLLKYIEQDIPF